MVKIFKTFLRHLNNFLKHLNTFLKYLNKFLKYLNNFLKYVNNFLKHLYISLAVTSYFFRLEHWLCGSQNALHDVLLCIILNYVYVRSVRINKRNLI